MEISGNLSSYTYVSQMPQKSEKGNKAGFGFDDGRKNMDPLIYYRNLAKSFLEITFRLSDKESDMRIADGCWHGYQGGLKESRMNQIGDHFSEPNQTSVDIDVSIIRRMQKDPEFEHIMYGELRGAIRNQQDRASSYAGEGMPYFCYVFDEYNLTTGIFSPSIKSAPNRFSTQEEIDKMWEQTEETGEHGKKQMFQHYYHQVEEDMLETFMKMVADGNQRIREDISQPPFQSDQ